MEVFKINFKSHIRSGNSIILILLISAFFPYAMALINHENINSFIWIGIFMFLICSIPCLLIHINYYVVNHRDIFEYSYQERKITITHRGKSVTFSLDDIDKIKRSMSFNLAANRSSVLLWDGYNHSYIYLKDGKKFTVTSLLVPNLRLPLEEGKVIIRQNFYRLAQGY